MTWSGYDVASFVDGRRQRLATPHVARKEKGSVIDDQTTMRHYSYRVSQRVRKRVEEIFGWMKTTGCLRKTRHRGLDRVEWMFTLATTAYNLLNNADPCNSRLGLTGYNLLPEKKIDCLHECSLQEGIYGQVHLKQVGPSDI